MERGDGTVDLRGSRETNVKHRGGAKHIDWILYASATASPWRMHPLEAKIITKVFYTIRSFPKFFPSVFFS